MNVGPVGLVLATHKIIGVQNFYSEDNKLNKIRLCCFISENS